MDRKLMIAAGLYPPDIGGPATYAKMIEEELPKRGLETTVLPFSAVRSYPFLLRHVLYAFKLWRRRKDLAAIYALDPISVGLPALLVSRLCRRPFVLRLGGDYAWEQGRVRFGLSATLDEYTKDRKNADWRTRVLARLEDLVVARASLVIVPSQYLKNIVSTWPGVLARRVVVINSALSPIHIPQSKEELREHLGYKGFTIVSAGRLVPWKGFAELIDAVAEIPKANLVIVGEGPEEERLKALAKARGLSLRVRFLGAQNKEALGGFIKAADLFVLNTGYEGLSHQILEAMYLEVPVLTTRIGGNPEVIKDGENGVLVKYGNGEALKEAIERLCADKELRERLARNAVLTLKNFNRDKVVDELKEILLRIM